MKNIISIMQTAYHLNIGSFEESFLLKTVNKRISETQLTDIGEYADFLKQNHSEALALNQSLVNSHSIFFRNPLVFALLEQQVLPACIKKNLEAGHKSIRIWSAGCATGQEPYSLAILLNELLSNQGGGMSYRIFATDFSETALEVATRGVYDVSGMQNVQLRWLNRCFEKSGNGYRISDQIREQVEFSVYDLCDYRSGTPPAGIYGDFDLVMCANLLFYYKAEVRLGILEKIRKSLIPDGYFVTGEAERDMVARSGAFRPLTASLPVFLCNK